MTPRPWRSVVLAVVVVIGVLGVGGAATGLWIELAGNDATRFQGLTEVVPWDEALVAPTHLAQPSATPAAEPAPAPEPAFDLAQHSTSDPASPWVIVNKQHPIAQDHEPADLVDVGRARVRAVAAPDVTAMVDAAQQAGVRLVVRSGYRSYVEQAGARAEIEARRGFAHAERYSARPGFSEHQTGLAVDFDSGSDPACNLQTCFARTAEGVWLAQHGWEFGFVVRYTEQNTAVTGYAPEGWHLRWVGRDLTAWMHEQGTGSLEEALGVAGGAEYPG
ncbi:M15 family metallopeptidase [Cellulomonas wangsupingiae]|uniref:M15 family metallopeptidase n=1 Tax=Cellulomonas wangsupingiae TaxID=2968085 RepID=A0ABY5K1Z2_9CELL|nr:M15 family metallopeptidase [Cellulomonas wangsupingiae]MCC2336672.1 M15 family metallopeptidase [Cellulomonas wangsupingiae]UUI64452.1 M15 family metallopeptidase [Cellulomonas wangsupingiae]